MPTFLVKRTDMVQLVCAHLRAHVPSLNLVRPYNGEVDRFSKKAQIQQDIFPAEVNLTTPFALVVSKSRERQVEASRNRTLRFRHEISVYVGCSNTHMLGDTETPAVLEYLDLCSQALNGAALVKGATPLTILNDGEYLITTDLFVVYDQRYYQDEIGY